MPLRIFFLFFRTWCYEVTYITIWMEQDRNDSKGEASCSFSSFFIISHISHGNDLSYINKTSSHVIPLSCSIVRRPICLVRGEYKKWQKFSSLLYLEIPEISLTWKGKNLLFSILREKFIHPYNFNIIDKLVLKTNQWNIFIFSVILSHKENKKVNCLFFQEIRVAK